MQSFKSLFFLGLITVLFSACFNRTETVDYNDWIDGDWVLHNAGELERYLGNSSERPYLLKNATISFLPDGRVETKLMKLDKQSWITHRGKWEISEMGDVLTIKSDEGPFNDQLKIDFMYERSFYIHSNRLPYHFIKL